MSRKIAIVTLILGIFLVCIGKSSSYDKIDVEYNNSIDDWSMNFLQDLLYDTEFMALSHNDQLAVLEVVYSIFESSYSQRKNTNRNHDINRHGSRHGSLNFGQEQNKK